MLQLTILFSLRATKKNICILSIKKFPYFLTHVLEETGICTCTCKIKKGGKEKNEKVSPFFRNNGETTRNTDWLGTEKKKKKCWWTKWNVSIRMVRIPLRNLTWQDLTFSNDFLLSPTFNPTFGPSFFSSLFEHTFPVELG